MKKTIAVLPGDGIGPEIIAEAVKILNKIAQVYNYKFEYEYGLIGGAAIDKIGTALPDETLDLCKKTNAILFGAIGDPKYDNDPLSKVRPEQGILGLRLALDLYTNLRPIHIFKSLIDKSPLKPEIVKDVDFVVVRELTGGIYFGKKGRTKNGNSAYDTSVYTKKQVTRISHVAFKLAGQRKSKVTLVDKANVEETSRLWREVVQDIAKSYPQIETEYMFVDNAAMQIIKRPSSFDVLLTDNMFGDILSDEASVITGSLGMLPSASIGDKTALYEPIHGSYPKATGLNTANPIGTILSAAMMLERSFGMTEESKAIYLAVEKVLEEGYGTKDITTDKILGTKELGDKITQAI